MKGETFIHITVGELQKNEHGRPLFKYVTNRLREHEFSRLFMYRSQHGIGEKHDLRFNLMETVSLNNLPISIEAIGNRDVVSLFSEQLNMSHGQVFEIGTQNPTHVLLKVYIVERFRWFRPYLYQEIIQLCKQNKLIWSTAHLGLRDSFFQMKTPVMIEVIGTLKQIDQLVPSIKTIAPDCKLFTIPVHVIMNK